MTLPPNDPPSPDRVMNAPRPSAGGEDGAAPRPESAGDEAGLPGVLLLGDSISEGYTPAVRAALAGRANVQQAFGGSTQTGLAKLPQLLGARGWAVIHFNFGLHDLKHWKDNQLDLSGPQVTPVADYEKNLTDLVGRLQATGADLVWATTTPVPPGANGRVAGEEIVFNAAAARVMERAGIPVNDLHAAASRWPELQKPENVHFTDEGSRRLGTQVAAVVAGRLSVARIQ